jgi:hypothetical protein
LHQNKREHQNWISFAGDYCLTNSETLDWRSVRRKLMWLPSITSIFIKYYQCWRVSIISVVCVCVSASSSLITFCFYVPRVSTFSPNLIEFLFNCWKCQFIIWWAGLMRGAVTIALSYNQASTRDNFILCWKFCCNC